MGDNESDNSAQKSLQADILPRTTFQTFHLRGNVLILSAETNHKNIPPPRPDLHISPRLPPHTHVPRLGLRVRQRLWADTVHNARVYIRALPATVACHGDTFLLPRRAVTRARELVTTRAAARVVQFERGGWREGRAGVWVLLGRCYKSVCAGVGVSVCGAISVYAACADGALVS